MSTVAHAGLSPSPWVVNWADLIAKGGRVLDLACGAGRHARWLAAKGWQVLAMDRDADALRDLATLERVQCRQADLEAGPWPLADEKFDGIVVTHYLHRPLWPYLMQALAPGGVLLYETFAHGNARFGRPASPAFLLQPGELLRELGKALHIIAYEDRFIDAPKPAMVQRICAARVADSNAVWP